MHPGRNFFTIPLQSRAYVVGCDIRTSIGSISYCEFPFSIFTVLSTVYLLKYNPPVSFDRQRKIVKNLLLTVKQIWSITRQKIALFIHTCNVFNFPASYSSKFLPNYMILAIIFLQIGIMEFSGGLHINFIFKNVANMIFRKITWNRISTSPEPYYT